MKWFKDIGSSRNPWHQFPLFVVVYSLLFIRSCILEICHMKIKNFEGCHKNCYRQKCFSHHKKSKAYLDNLTFFCVTPHILTIYFTSWNDSIVPWLSFPRDKNKNVSWLPNTSSWLNESRPLPGQECFGHHDDVSKWKHFPHNWPFVRGIHRSKASDTERWCFLWYALE